MTRQQQERRDPVEIAYNGTGPEDRSARKGANGRQQRHQVRPPAQAGTDSGAPAGPAPKH